MESLAEVNHVFKQEYGSQEYRDPVTEAIVLLSDIVKATEYDLDKLGQELTAWGIAPEATDSIIHTIDLLSKDPNMVYGAYMKNLLASSVASKVECLKNLPNHDASCSLTPEKG